MLGNVNPLAPITVGSGFIITVNPGIVLIAGTPVTVISTVISLTPSATNFIYVNTSGTVVVNTSGFPAGVLPVSTVTTSSTSVTSIIDSRSDFALPSSGTNNSIFFPYGASFNTSGSASAYTQNVIFLQGAFFPDNVSVTNIIVNVASADGAGLYDWGIYDSTGLLKCHVGAHSAGASAIVDLPVVSGPITIVSGKYYFAVTTNNAAPNLTLSNISNRQINYLINGTSATPSVGGVLPTNIAIPADTWATAVTFFPAFATH